MLEIPNLDEWDRYRSVPVKVSARTETITEKAAIQDSLDTELERPLLIPQPEADPNALDQLTQNKMARKARRRLERVLFAGAVMLGSTIITAEDYKTDIMTSEHHALHHALVAIDSWKESLTTKIFDNSPKGPLAVLPKVPGPIENVPLTPAFPKTHFKNSDPLFAAEPTFLQNFTAMPNGSLDSSKWNYSIGNGVNGWGNQEAEYYTASPTNVRIENGSLVIQANEVGHYKTKTLNENGSRVIEAQRVNYRGFDYTSARINTLGKESFLFGKIEIDAKMPAGESTWPAIWLLSSNNSYVDLSPPSDRQRYLNSGEIDIAEEYGPTPSYVQVVAHHAGISRNAGAVEVPDDTTQFNTYTLEWTPTKLIYLVNGKPFYEYSKPANATYVEWPFDKPFYLIINDAIRGTRVQGTKPGDVKYNPVNDSMFAANGGGPLMQIRSIAYYPYEGAKPTKAQLAELDRTAVSANS